MDRDITGTRQDYLLRRAVVKARPREPATKSVKRIIVAMPATNATNNRAKRSIAKRSESPEPEDTNCESDDDAHQIILHHKSQDASNAEAAELQTRTTSRDKRTTSPNADTGDAV